MDIIGRTTDISRIFRRIYEWWAKAHIEHREMASILYKEKQIFERLQRLCKRLHRADNPDKAVIAKYIIETREAINRGYKI